MKKRKNKFIKKLLMGLALFAFIFPLFLSTTAIVNARIELQPQVPFGDVKTGVTLPEYINAIYKYLIAAGGVLAGIMLAVGGFMYVSSAGDSGKAASGKKYIINALVGMVLLASSYTILYTINPAVTELPDIEVSEIEKVPSGGNCKCDKDSDCGANKYCVDSSDMVPFNPKVSSPVADALGGVFDIFMSIATFPIGMSAAAGPKLVVQGGAGGAKALAKSFATAVGKNISKLAKTLATKAKGGVIFVIKNPGKFAWKATKGVAWGIGGITVLTGITLIASSGFSLTLGASCPNPDGKSICVPNLFKYNLIPHGMGPTNVPGLALKLNTEKGEMEAIEGPRTFLYNKDGSLPPRRVMLGDAAGTYAAFYFLPPLANIEPVYINITGGISGPISGLVDFTLAVNSKLSSYVGLERSSNMADLLGVTKGKNFYGVTNRDACDPSNNHCPCIEWETWDTENAIYNCKRQARCLDGDDLFPKLNADYSFCLTGDKGEPCRDDNDCRSGNKCVVLTKGAGTVGLLYPGVMTLLNDTTNMTGELKNQFAKITSNDRKLYALDPPFHYDQMCMPTVGGGSSGVIDSECTITGAAGIYCEPGTGINQKPCKPIDVATNSEKAATALMKCGSLSVFCFKEKAGAIMKYDVSSFSNRKEVISHSMVYTANGKQGCFDHYSKLNDVVEKVENVLTLNGGVFPYEVFLFSGDYSALQFDRTNTDNILNEINNRNLNFDLYSATIRRIIPLLKKEIVNNKQSVKDSLKDINNYIYQANGQCYLKVTTKKVGGVTLANFQENVAGDTIDYVVPYFFINLSNIAGEIATWDYKASGINAATCVKENKGYAFKDRFWVFYNKIDN